MLQFAIDWKEEYDYFDDKNPKTLLKLNDEWTIEFISAYNSDLGENEYNSMQIRRTHSVGDVSVCGELTIELYGEEIWKGKFSRFIKSGSSSAEIVSNLHFSSSDSRWLHGHVNIIENSEKFPNDSEIHLQSLEELSRDLKRLLEPKEACFTDVVLRCGDASIQAHKNILSARSPVFAAMFAHPMKESLRNEVDVTDIDVSTLRALLNYIYTGKSSDMTVSLATDLLFAADKYQIQDLKKVCSYFLKVTVSPHNVLKILIYGDMHDEDLKHFALEFICQNCAEFSVLENTEEWKNLQKVKPALAVDVLMSLVKSKGKK